MSLSDSQVYRSLLLLIALQLFLVVIGLVKIMPYQIDDAFITYRYVDNFLRSGMVVFNAGGEPVEGFTSQLWFWLMVVIARIFNIENVSLCGPLLGVSSLCISVAVLWFGLQKKMGALPVFTFIVVILSLPSVAFYAVTGLEELFFAFLVMFVGLCFAGYFRNQCAGVILIFATIWTRPEAPWLLVMLGIKILHERSYKGSLVYIAAVIFSLLTLIVYRYQVFGDILPNTYYAKTPELHKGMQYFADAIGKYWWFSFLIILSAVGALLGDHKNRLVFLFGMSWLLVPVLEGGDWMYLLRFFLPAMLLLAFSVQGILGAEAESLKNALMMVVIIPMLFYFHYYMHGIQNVYPRYQLNNQVIDVRVQAWFDANHVKRIAAVDIGTMFFQKDYQILDLVGLTDREIARMPGKYLSRNITAEFLLQKEVEVVLFRLAKLPSVDAVLKRENFDNDTELHLFFDPVFLRHYDLVMMIIYLDQTIATDFWGYIVMARKDLHLSPEPLHTKPVKGFNVVDYSVPVITKIDNTNILSQKK